MGSGLARHAVRRMLEPIEHDKGPDEAIKFLRSFEDIAKGTDLDLPIWGTGPYDWKGLLPASANPREGSMSSMPQVVGTTCVLCHSRIEDIIDGVFCGRCGCPVHHACAQAEEVRPLAKNM